MENFPSAPLSIIATLLIMNELQRHARAFGYVVFRPRLSLFRLVVTCFKKLSGNRALPYRMFLTVFYYKASGPSELTVNL